MGMTKFGPARATLEARIVAGVNELVQVRNLFPFLLLWLFLGFFPPFVEFLMVAPSRNALETLPSAL